MQPREIMRSNPSKYPLPKKERIQIQKNMKKEVKIVQKAIDPPQVEEHLYQPKMNLIASDENETFQALKPSLLDSPLVHGNMDLVNTLSSSFQLNKILIHNVNPLENHSQFSPKSGNFRGSQTQLSPKKQLQNSYYHSVKKE